MNDQMPQDTSWFNEAPAPAPSPPAKISKRLIVIVVSILVLTLGVVSVYYFSSSTDQRTACLTAADYTALTGSTLTDDTLSPTTNFYTDTVLFASNATAYDNASNSGANGEALLKKIATFYTTHNQTSIKVTINSSYTDKSAAALAKQRTTTVSSTLARLGIAEQDIVVTDSIYSQPEEIMLGDAVSTQVSLTSATSCVEER